MSSSVQTITATDFKARCLGILDQLAERRLSRGSVTKRGRVVAVLTPPEEAMPATLGDLFGGMRGTVIAPEGFDFTAPALDEPLDAERGILHR